MKVRILDFDEKHYASNMTQLEGLLKWDSMGATHNLIIRGKFGSDIQLLESDTSALERIPQEMLMTEKEIKSADNKYLTFFPKGHVNNFQIPVSPAAYAIFCCEYDAGSGICTIYRPNAACLYQCNVASNIEVRISYNQTKKCLFSRKKSGSYYSVLIPTIPGYMDGDLYYTYEQCKYKYPITKNMLGKPFNVLPFNGRAPIINTSNCVGYQITYCK